MVRAQAGGAVQQSRSAFGRETVFVCVAADTRHPFEGEVERSGGKTGSGEKGNEKGPQTAVDVEGERFSKSETREGGDVVNDAVCKGWGGTDEEDRVAVD